MISPQALSAREYFDCLALHLSDRFVYDEAAADTVKEPATALRPEALAILSEELRRELGDALASLDATRVAELICRITELNPALGGVLAHHATPRSCMP